MFLEDDSTGEISDRKDRYEEEVSKPPETMDGSSVDRTIDGERNSGSQKKVNPSPDDFHKTRVSSTVTVPPTSRSKNLGPYGALVSSKMGVDSW